MVTKYGHHNSMHFCPAASWFLDTTLPLKPLWFDQVGRWGKMKQETSQLGREMGKGNMKEISRNVVQVGSKEKRRGEVEIRG